MSLTRTVAGQVERYCRRGQHWQPWTAEFFGRSHDKANGLSTVCKACRQQQRRLYLTEPPRRSILPEPYQALERAMRGWSRE